VNNNHVMTAGNIVFVTIADREIFDQIDRPVTDHSEKGQRVLTKVIGDMVTNEGAVVFQYWLELKSITQPSAEEAKGAANQ
jgi:hypothetical protein